MGLGDGDGDGGGAGEATRREEGFIPAMLGAWCFYKYLSTSYLSTIDSTTGMI